MLKGLNFVPTSNTSKLKMELETLGRMLRLKRHFRNEEKPGKVKSQFSLVPQSSFNPDNKDSNIELYMNSLEKKLMKIEIPEDRCNGLTSEERKALYDLKNDKDSLIEDAGSVCSSRLG